MIVSKETLEEHIRNGDRQSDAARALGFSRNRISQLVRYYELDWPRPNDHQHGPGLRPKYRPGCEECKTLMRAATAARRAKKKET